MSLGRWGPMLGTGDFRPGVSGGDVRPPARRTRGLVPAAAVHPGARSRSRRRAVLARIGELSMEDWQAARPRLTPFFEHRGGCWTPAVMDWIKEVSDES